MKNLNWKGIVAGFIIYEILGTLIYLSTRYNFKGVEIRYLRQGWNFAYLRDAVCGIVAGYIAARNHSENYVRDEIALFVVICTLTLIEMIPALLQLHLIPAWLFFHWLVLSCLTFAWLCLGGYIRSRRAPKPAKPVSEILQSPIPEIPPSP